MPTIKQVPTTFSPETVSTIMIAIPIANRLCFEINQWLVHYCTSTIVSPFGRGPYSAKGSPVWTPKPPLTPTDPLLVLGIRISMYSGHRKKIMKKEYTYILHWHKLVQSIRIQSCVTSYHFRTAQLFVNYFTIKCWEVDWVMAISHRRQTAMQALELLWIAWQLSGHPLQFDITPIFHIPNQTLSLSFSQWPQPCCPTFFFFF